MFCPSCGKRIEDADLFCQTCGAKLGQTEECPQVLNTPMHTRDSADITPTKTTPIKPSGKPDRPMSKQNKPSRKRIAVATAMALGAIVLASAAILAGLTSARNAAPQPQPSATDPAENGNGSAGELLDTESPRQIESSWGRITIPSAWKDAVAYAEMENKGVFTTADGKTVLATIYWGAKESGSSENKQDVYFLYPDQTLPETTKFMLEVYYVDDTGSNVHWNRQGSFELGFERILGISVEEFASWCEIAVDAAYAPVTLETAQAENPSEGETSTEAGAGTGISNMQPFWGVWVGASQNEAEATAIAEAVELQGFSPYVALTTDWANLNTDPWYVVSTGLYPTEEAAHEALPHAQATVDANAYVKYSGEYCVKE